MTDSCEVRVAHLKLEVAFQSHILFARKLQNYGDAFFKSSSIYSCLIARNPDFVACGTVKTLYNVTHYNRIFNIQHIFVGN